MISLGFADVAFLFIGFFLYVTGSPVVEQQVMGRQQYQMEAEARVEEINRGGGSWKAKLHPRLAELSDEEIRRQFLGLAMDSEEHIKRREKMLSDGHENLVKNEGRSKQMPLSFDARDEWPECADLIGKIQDQSRCGSCWAVSSASVMQDRICIGSNGTQKVEISAKDLLTCDPKSHGCNGGFPNKAFEFWHTNGVVSGSNYAVKKGCKPYPFPPHSREQYDTPPCMRHCDSWKNWYQYKSDKHYGLKPTSLKFAKQEKIMDAIRQGGPVVAGMIVYKDFIDYDSGVYEHGRKAKILGGHAVRIVGWGVDEASGKPYWLVANSWNTDWGMDGYFKIARGKDESYIESWLIAFADPKL